MSELILDNIVLFINVLKSNINIIVLFINVLKSKFGALSFSFWAFCTKNVFRNSSTAHTDNDLTWGNVSDAEVYTCCKIDLIKKCVWDLVPLGDEKCVTGYESERC